MNIFVITLSILCITQVLSEPSSELIHTDQTCGPGEEVATVFGIANANECETACYNRHLTNNDCSFFSYYPIDFYCSLFSSCDSVITYLGSETYEMTVISGAPTSSPTKAPTGVCDCQNGGVCINNHCHCIFPNFGSNCELQKDCSCIT